MEKYICKKCKSEITEEDFNYSEDNGFFENREHIENCGCIKEDMIDGISDGYSCNCEFIKKENKNV